MLHQEPQEPILVNKRRQSRFTLVRQKHMLPILAGALCATIVLHLLGFTLLSFFGAGLDLFPITSNDPDETEIPVVIAQPDDEPDPVPPPDQKPPDEKVEVVPLEELKMDVEDLPVEELVIAPGPTEINLEGGAGSVMEKLSPRENDVSMSEQIQKGTDEPAFNDALSMTDNPVKVAAIDQPSETDPDQWYKDQLKGANGVDDSNLPDGSKTLGQLLAMSPGTLGKGSGYSRLGADLLFEYNQAALKNTARVDLLRLAALIYKNPETIFVIEGHTDSFGSPEYNTLLSLMRANAVRLWLKDNGIDLSKVYIRPCGNNMPVVSTAGDKAKQAANRRVEIHMRKRGEAIPEGALPASYAVDMKTPIARQLAAKPNLPSLPSARPVNRNVPPRQERKTGEAIPVASPVDDHVPSAVPVEDDIPVAVPL